MSAARSDVASRRIYIYSPQAGRQYFGSPRAYSGAAVARKCQAGSLAGKLGRALADFLRRSRGADAICHLLQGIRREGGQQQRFGHLGEDDCIP